jgi:hypothetical protein
MAAYMKTTRNLSGKMRKGRHMMEESPHGQYPSL